MNIENFVGNKNLLDKISSLLTNKKFPHAIALWGEQGTGKFTLAKIIAKALLCEKNVGYACNECKSCKKIDSNVHPDVIFPNASGALNTYSIDTVRTIRNDAYISPNETTKKVYIFKNIDNMQLGAQNALLKIIEEPPSHAIFIFTCESFYNILPTVRSRIQDFQVTSPNSVEANNFISKIHPEYSSSNITNAVNITDGNIGKALDILQSDELNSLLSLSEKMSIAITSPNEFELLKLFSQLTDSKKTKIILSMITSIFRKCLLYSSGVELKNFINNDIIKICNTLTTNKIMLIIEEISQTEKLLKRNVNLNLLLTNLCSRFHVIAFSD